MSVKDVEDALKIRSKYIQALEQDDFEVIPGPTFVKAFLRTYSSFLGLDTDLMMDEYLSRYEPQFRGQHQVIGRSTGRAGSRGRRRQPNYLIVGVVALLLIVVLALVFRNRGEGPAVIDPTVITTSTTSSDTTISLSETPQTTDGASSSSGAADASSVAASSAGADASLAIVLTATGQRCWLTVREESADGKTLFSGTLKQGEKLSYSRTGQLYLNIGDPASVRLMVNGKKVDVPEPYGEFVLSAAGLSRL